MSARGGPFECTFCIHNFTRKAAEGLRTSLRRRGRICGRSRSATLDGDARSSLPPAEAVLLQLLFPQLFSRRRSDRARPARWAYRTGRCRGRGAKGVPRVGRCLGGDAPGGGPALGYRICHGGARYATSAGSSACGVGAATTRRLPALADGMRRLNAAAHRKARALDSVRGRPNLLWMFWANTNRDPAFPAGPDIRPNIDSSPLSAPIATAADDCAAAHPSSGAAAAVVRPFDHLHLGDAVARQVGDDDLVAGQADRLAGENSPPQREPLQGGVELAARGCGGWPPCIQC